MLRENYQPQDLFAEINPLINWTGGTISVDDTVVEKIYSNQNLVKFINHFWSGNKKKTVFVNQGDPEGISYAARVLLLIFSNTH